MNKRLRMLEITDPTSYYDSDAEEEFDAEKAFKHILVDFNGKMLPDFLPLNLKLAFLSVIQHVSSVGTVRYHMDSFMVSTIFKFAAKTVRRRILWTELYPPETPPDEYSGDGTPSYNDSEGQALDEFW